MPSDRAQIRRIAEELEAPHAARVLVAEELAADLEALRGELVARGVPPGSARRRAASVLAPSEEGLRELGRLHRPLGARLRDRSATPWGRLELALFAGLSLPVLGSYLVGLGRSGMLLTGGGLGPVVDLGCGGGRCNGAFLPVARLADGECRIDGHGPERCPPVWAGLAGPVRAGGTVCGD